MLRPTLLILAAAVSALAAPLDAQHGEPHWSYAGPTGPQRWTTLGYEQCDDGAQTPIDLSDEQPADPLALRAAYGRWHEPAFTNNGHTVLLLPQGANTLEVAGRAYELLQVHAHVPSEHTLGGHRFAAELHAVHRDAAGGLLVLGTFVETGPAAAAWEPVLAALPGTAGDTTHVSGEVDLTALLELDGLSHEWLEAYDQGSLTTPPCSEGVRWIIRRRDITLSAEQLDALESAMIRNARPLMPRNGRVVRLHRPH